MWIKDCKKSGENAGLTPYQLVFSKSRISKTLNLSIGNGREGLNDTASIGQNELLSNSG